MATSRDGWTVRNKQTQETVYFTFEERCIIRHMVRQAEENDWDDVRWVKNFRAEIQANVSDQYILDIRNTLEIWDVREVAMPK